MAFIPDFDIDDIITTLNSASAKLAKDSKERDAIELAQIALLYARHIHKSGCLTSSRHAQRRTLGSPVGRLKKPSG